MGKYKGKHQRVMKRDFKQSRPDKWSEKSRSQPERSEYNNELFVEYYKKQGVVPEGQWEEFMEVLKTPLPTTFRINGTGKFATDLRDKLESDFLSNFNKDPIMVAGETLQPPRPLPWYSNKLAWHMSFSRGQLRKLPILAEIHELLKRENEAGSITRQEAVSMVPPLFLGVEPHHRILDMCAAPGSKTAQILEMLHAGTMMPTGIVVANDADAQRCNLLAHQTKRMCSPALIVTNHDATMYPIVTDHTAKESILFDRILCDVPCSGDGTIRKAPDIWRRWTPGNGNGLHPLQLRIALHACQMLKVGGRLVYSTCTFNPVEDEAVVAEVLRMTGSAMQLLDLSDHLPGLPRLPGLKKWYARDKIQYYSNWEEASQNGPHKLTKSMFPDAQSDELPLERCMRILPHHSDTGGFFIAVFEKMAKYPQPAPKQEAAAAGSKRPRPQEPEPGTPEAAEPGIKLETPSTSGRQEGSITAAVVSSGEPTAATTAAGTAPGSVDADDKASPPQWGVRGGGGRNRGVGGRFKGLDPVVPVTDPEILSSISDFYGIAKDFPLWDQIITRSLEPGRPKRLYFVSSGVKHLLQNDDREALKVTMTGLKVFERQELKDGEQMCRYRIVQDGLPLLLPYVTRDGAELAGGEPQKPRHTPEDSHTLEQIRGLKHGCCVVMLREGEAASLGLDTSKQTEDALSVHAPLAVAAWKGKGSINILVSKGECAQIAERLKKAMANAAQGEPLQNQAGAVLAHQASPTKAPGYEGDVEMQ
ncbi:MAG: tRNA (cytosine-5-)-methyltransferase NSUN2 [Trebouxia sp. A1-2]|nr:MAG: tRNA (cytosine-5-)-methyltransferase NSUN2 [Trebouxia sp. A1-2]